MFGKTIDRILDTLAALILIGSVAFVLYGISNQCEGTAINAPVFNCKVK